MSVGQLIRNHLRDQGSPKEEQCTSLWNLMYLFFLFINWAQSPVSSWLPATLVSVPIFLTLYFHAIRGPARDMLWHAVAIGALGFALTPLNTSANTYLIYAGVLLPFSGIALQTSILIIVAGLALYAVELVVLRYPVEYLVIMIGVTAIVAIAICAANHFRREKGLRQADLKLSHDEIRRLAATAERERIGRDLHDLLGHTLSLVAIKSELAGKLLDRDPAAARKEVLEVERVAREALAQVRRAVTGIRAAGLAAELASARLLLESAGIRFAYSLAEVGLAVELETTLALCVREAVTNIQRHARASRADATLTLDGQRIVLIVQDDGRGGMLVPGNGLIGMRERIEALGGELRVDSVRSKGTRIEARLPVPTHATETDIVTVSASPRLVH
ncbi:MAG: sensor histidine kinase [Rhodanobacteraceae bacterium]